MNPINFVKFIEKSHPEYKWEDIKRKSIRSGRDVPSEDNDNAYIDGLKNGRFNRYDLFAHDDGKDTVKLTKELNYKDGKLDGVKKEYYFSGKLLSIDYLVNGRHEGESIQYDEEGNVLVKRYYKGGLLDGKFIRYNERDPSKLRTVIDYKDGKENGEHRDYYPNGNLLQVYGVIDDIRRGPYKLYWENGNIKKESNYGPSPDPNKDPNFVQHVGVSKDYREDGTIERYLDLDKGITITYNENGDKSYESQDKGERVTSKHFVNGILLAVGNFKKIPYVVSGIKMDTYDLIKDGPFIFYDNDGNVNKTTYYKDNKEVKKK